MQKRVHALETNRRPPGHPAAKLNRDTLAVFDELPPRRIDAAVNPCVGGIASPAAGNAANPNSNTALSPGPIIVIDDAPYPPGNQHVAARVGPTSDTSAGNANDVINLVTDSEGEGENPTVTSEVRRAPLCNLHTLPNIVIIDDDPPLIRSQQGQGPVSPLSPVPPPRTPVLSLRSPRLLERLQASQELPDQALCKPLHTQPLLSASATSSEYRTKGPAHMGYAARVAEEIEANPRDDLSSSQVYPQQDHGSVNQNPVTPVSPLDRALFTVPRKNDRKGDMAMFWLNDPDQAPKNDDEDADCALPVRGTKRPRSGRLRRFVDCSSGEEDSDDDNGDDDGQPIVRPAFTTSPIRRSPRFQGSRSSIPARRSPRLNETQLKEEDGADSEPEEIISPPRRSPRFSQVTQNGDIRDADAEMTPTRKSPRFSQTPHVEQVKSDSEPATKPVVIAGIAVSDDSGSDVEKSAMGRISQRSMRAQRRENPPQPTNGDAERKRKLRLLGYSPEDFDSEDEETSPDEEIKRPSRQRRRTRKNASASECEGDSREGINRPPAQRRRRIRKNASLDDGEEGSSEEEVVAQSRRRRVTRRARTTTRTVRQNFGYKRDDFVVEDGEESEESDVRSSSPKRGRSAGNESDHDAVMQDSSSSSSDSEQAPRTEVEKEHAKQVREAMGGVKVPRGLQDPIICYICRLQGNRRIGTPQNGWRDGWIQPVHNFSVNVQKGNYGVRMTVPYCLMHTAGDQNRYIEQLQCHVRTTQGEAREEGAQAPRTVQNLESEDEEDEEHSEGWRDYEEDLDFDSDDDFIVPSSDE